MDINLQSLNLQSRWPKLTRLQDEVAGLEKRLQEAEAEVQQRRAAIGPAREQDLDGAAVAVRRGEKAPKATHETEAKGRLQTAEHTRDVLARAVESARTDYGAFLSKHRSELFADVVEARAKIAASVAQAAREALRGFGQWSDMYYTLKSLAPPVEAADPAAPARDTMTIIGPAQTQRSGPDRGHVEAALNYLVSLGTGPTQGDSDAAA